MTVRSGSGNLHPQFIPQTETSAMCKHDIINCKVNQPKLDSIITINDNKGFNLVNSQVSSTEMNESCVVAEMCRRIAWLIITKD